MTPPRHRGSAMASMRMARWALLVLVAGPGTVLPPPSHAQRLERVAVRPGVHAGTQPYLALGQDTDRRPRSGTCVGLWLLGGTTAGLLAGKAALAKNKGGLSRTFFRPPLILLGFAVSATGGLVAGSVGARLTC